MKPIKFLASLVISYGAAWLGNLATTPNIPTWYTTIDKPFFTPPNWLFGPVWAVLYLLIAISLYLVWTADTSRSKCLAYVVFGMQMALNVLWSVVFFGLHQPAWALAVIVALDTLVLATILLFRHHSRVASLLLIPYLLWICFATLLNAAIAGLN